MEIKIGDQCMYITKTASGVVSVFDDLSNTIAVIINGKCGAKVEMDKKWTCIGFKEISNNKARLVWKDWEGYKKETVVNVEEL